MMEYGIQMFSVRDLSEKDLREAVKEVAALGYHGIEFAGFFGHTPEAVNEMLQENGVYVSGSHSSLSDLLEHYEETVSFHKAIGNHEYILPWAPMDNREQMDTLIREVNRLQPMLQKEGIRLSYHNHAHEFRMTEEGFVPYDELLNHTDIHLEIDTYWAYVAGKNPVEMMEKLKDRITFIHIKDGDESGKGAPLGQGTAPVSSVYQKAAELQIPMVVESETLNPDGITEAAVCMDFLRKKEAKL